jgi:hypothetical protein
MCEIWAPARLAAHRAVAVAASELLKPRSNRFFVQGTIDLIKRRSA